jgi:hypothetical protein
VDILLDRAARRAVGFEVFCRDGAHRFLPLPTASIGAEEIAIPSPLVLLERDELGFYRSRAVALSALRGLPVVVGGNPAGKLRDVVVAGDGELLDVIVETDHGVVRVPFEDSVTLAPVSRTAA